MCNIQKDIGLAKGAWNEEAWNRLKSWLASAKRGRKRKQPMLQLHDALPRAPALPLPLGDLPPPLVPQVDVPHGDEVPAVEAVPLPPVVPPTNLAPQSTPGQPT